MTPEIVLVARHNAIIEFNEDGLPVPEPAIPNGEDDRGDGEAPDEEIHTNIPAGVNGAAFALKESKKEEKRVVEEREKDLSNARSAKWSRKGLRRWRWMPPIAIDVSRGACEEDWGVCAE